MTSLEANKQNLNMMIRESNKTRVYDGNRGVIGGAGPVVIGKDRIKFGTADSGKVAQDIYMQMSRPSAVLATKAQTPIFKKNGAPNFS